MRAVFIAALCALPLLTGCSFFSICSSGTEKCERNTVYRCNEEGAYTLAQACEGGTGTDAGFTPYMCVETHGRATCATADAPLPACVNAPGVPDGGGRAVNACSDERTLVTCNAFGFAIGRVSCGDGYCRQDSCGAFCTLFPDPDPACTGTVTETCSEDRRITCSCGGYGVGRSCGNADRCIDLFGE